MAAAAKCQRRNDGEASQQTPYGHYRRALSWFRCCGISNPANLSKPFMSQYEVIRFDPV